MKGSVRVRGLEDVIYKLDRLGRAPLSVHIDIASNRPDAPRIITKLRKKGAIFIDRRIGQQIAEDIKTISSAQALESYKGGTPSTRAYQGVARKAEGLVKGRITSGSLGKNAPRYERYKSRAVQRGKMTGKYGDPPPFGVATAGLVDNMRAYITRGERR